MKILYFNLSVLILIALPPFIQTSVLQPKDQLDTYEKTSRKRPRRQKEHRGSGRKNYLIIHDS